MQNSPDALDQPGSCQSAEPLLAVRNLTVEFITRRGTISVLKQIDLDVAKGETLAVVGESGSGKSVTSYAIMGILDRAGRIADGAIAFSGLDLIGQSDAQMRDMRGRDMSMIFQNPRAALNPIRKVGHQIEDVLRQHGVASASNARHKAVEVLEQVRIARPEERYHAYPFELSGGMCQRVVIALALACKPQLLIADEPTTGLDVTTQKAVMELIVELTRERGMSTILITHDLGLAAAYADRVVVMERGRVVETAPAARIFRNPGHAYTRRLMRATPRPGAGLRDLLPEQSEPSAAVDGPAAKSASKSASKTASSDPTPSPLLEVTGLIKAYPTASRGFTLLKSLSRKDRDKPQSINAVDGIGFHVGRGESVGLVGESGCGKSTTSMMVMRLIDTTAGQILFDGIDISTIAPRDFARSPLRPRIQMVFQDPTDSLNPRFTAARAIADPLLRFATDTSAMAVRARCEELAVQVGLPIDLLDRFPHQLSGGQKARVGIARAIALNPDLVILDEPTAALDVSVQAVVLNLLQDLKGRLGMSYLFVSHDLNVVRLLCDRVIVMRQGQIVEQGATEQVLSQPTAAYTRALLSAIPKPPV